MSNVPRQVTCQYCWDLAWRKAVQAGNPNLHSLFRAELRTPEHEARYAEAYRTTRECDFAEWYVHSSFSDVSEAQAFWGRVGAYMDSRGASA